MAMKGIALTHTGFNVINAFIFLPLLPLLARLLIKLAPDKGFKEEPHLSYLDVRMLDTPAIGIQQSANEVQRMGRGIDEMMQKLRITLPLEAPDEVVEKRVFQLEENLDTIQREIVEFLGKMLAGNVPHEVMDRGRGQIRMADELETISDYVCSVLKLRIRLRKNGLEMSEVGVSGLFDLHDHVFAFLRIINSAIAKEDSTILANARTDGAAITRLFKQIRSEHLTRVEAGLVSPLKSLIYMDMLTAYRRIKDHGVNIAEVLSGDK
jgi:phosphate:Na+ symporter